MEDHQNNNVSSRQIKKLIEFMQQNQELRNDRFTSTFTFSDLQRRWEQIASELNSLPGDNKDWRLWRKTWQELKNQIERKYRELRRSDNNDGNRPQSGLTEDEERLLEIVLNTSGTSTDSLFTDSEHETVDDFDHEGIVTESTNRSLIQERIIDPPRNSNRNGAIVTNQNNRQRTGGQSSRRRTIIMCSNICRRKLSIKKHYYEQKLRLMAREVRAKERIAAALELLANRNFNN